MKKSTLPPAKFTVQAKTGAAAKLDADPYNDDAVGPPKAAKSGSMRGAAEQLGACPAAASGPIEIV